uniref:THAP-type domain-containing protein n=1 Tax=Gadus morhua TaxID=8049 RepID=A0A8C5CUU2_GADMO
MLPPPSKFLLTMVRKCFLGCEGTSPLYGLPKAEPSRSRWLDFIFNPIPPTLPSLFLCRLHFTDGCFSNLRLFSNGFAKLLALREDAVPTLCGPMGEDASQHQDCSAHYRPFEHVGCQTDTPQSISTGTQTNSPVGMHSVGIQSARLKSTSVGTQLSMGSLKAHVRSKAMQTQVSPVSADFGTTAHLQDSLLTSTPIKGPGWRPSKRPRLELEEEEESDSSNESHKDPLDSTYNPGDSVLTEETDVSYETQPTPNEAKYIVFESCLKQLLENCPVCKGGCDLQQRRIGTYVAFTQKCLHCSYFRHWESQPMAGNTPIGNLQLSAAPYFTGSSFIQLQKVNIFTIIQICETHYWTFLKHRLCAFHVKVCEAMQLQIFQYDTFRRHARNYMEPAIVHKWKMDQQHHFQQQLRLGGSVAVGGDMRADSPGL